MILTDDFDCRSYNSSPVKKRPQQRLNRVRGALNRSCSVPDSNNPPCFLPPTHGDISVPVSNLTKIGAEGPLWGDSPQRLNREKSRKSFPYCRSEDNQVKKSIKESCREECEVKGSLTLQNPTCSPVCCQEADEGSAIHRCLDIPNNHVTKSMLCLNEESQDEVSLWKVVPPLLVVFVFFVFTDCPWQLVSGAGMYEQFEMTNCKFGTDQ